MLADLDTCELELLQPEVWVLDTGSELAFKKHQQMPDWHDCQASAFIFKTGSVFPELTHIDDGLSDPEKASYLYLKTRSSGYNMCSCLN